MLMDKGFDGNWDVMALDARQRWTGNYRVEWAELWNKKMDDNHEAMARYGCKGVTSVNHK